MPLSRRLHQTKSRQMDKWVQIQASRQKEEKTGAPPARSGQTIFFLHPYHASRIHRTVASIEEVKRFAKNRGSKRVKLQPITKGQFVTLPSHIAVSRVVERGEKGQRERKTRRYVAQLDNNENNPLRGANTMVRVHLGHEPMHIRHAVFAHEHGLKRNEFSALSVVEEWMFSSPRNEFKYDPVKAAYFKGNSFTKRFEAIADTTNSTTFTARLKNIVEGMEITFTHHFPSRRAYLRAIVELNQDPTMRTVLRRLNSIPITLNASTDYDPRLSPKYWRKLRGILQVFNFMMAKAVEYRTEKKPYKNVRKANRARAK